MLCLYWGKRSILTVIVLALKNILWTKAEWKHNSLLQIWDELHKMLCARSSFKRALTQRNLMYFPIFLVT